MDKEIQRIAWSCLPKVFKEEVKGQYSLLCQFNNVANAPAKNELEYLFGIHNLTSDAEGEELLCVSRKKVQEFYAKCKEVTMNPKSYPDYAHESALSRMALLDILFGSKCLPDEVGNEDNFATKEPEPAEPKFKVGDTASYVCSPTLKYKCTVTKVMQNEHSGKWEYNVMFEWGKPGMWITESDLEPYTEPREDLIPPNSGN